MKKIEEKSQFSFSESSTSNKCMDSCSTMHTDREHQAGVQYRALVKSEKIFQFDLLIRG